MSGLFHQEEEEEEDDDDYDRWAFLSTTHYLREARLAKGSSRASMEWFDQFGHGMSTAAAAAAVGCLFAIYLVSPSPHLSCSKTLVSQRQYKYMNMWETELWEECCSFTVRESTYKQV